MNSKVSLLNLSGNPGSSPLRGGLEPLLTGAQVHDQMALPVDALGCLHRKPSVLYTRLHQQGCPHHWLIHQEMVLHEGQGFIRGGAIGALKGEGGRSGQLSPSLQLTRGLCSPSLPLG